MYHTLPHHAITNHAQPHRTITNHTPPHHAITNYTLPHNGITNHTLPHHAIANHTLPHHAKAYHTLPHHAKAYHTLPHHAITNHTLPHHAITNHTLPHHAITNHTLPHHALPNHALQASPLWDGPGSVHNNGVGLCLHAQIKGAETHAKPNSIRSQQRDTNQAWYSSTQPSTFQCNHPFHCVSCSTNQGLIKKNFLICTISMLFLLFVNCFLNKWIS